MQIVPMKTEKRHKKGVITMSSIQSYGFLFNSMPGAGSVNNNSYSFLSGGSSLLGDYSMIKSGVYKKLLTAYYQKSSSDSDTSESDKSSSVKSKSVNDAEKAKLISVKSGADDLQEAAGALSKSSLYRSTGKDKDGKDIYDMDGIIDSVKKFVSAYNSYLDASSDVDSTSILSKTLSMVKATASNKNLLKDIGITIGADNKLVLDEEKFSSASMSKISSLFKGSGSYAGTIAQRASEGSRLANSAALTSGTGSFYTYSGNYSVAGNVNNMLDTLL